eukprot:scaffold1220_cov259-Pinguiococcus_pyrenoidosus.AAC.100
MATAACKGRQRHFTSPSYPPARFSRQARTFPSASQAMPCATGARTSFLDTGALHAATTARPNTATVERNSIVMTGVLRRQPPTALAGSGETPDWERPPTCGR